MEPKTVKRVVVAGGGTAGWIAAAALSRTLGALIEVTLVESDDIGTVGVGEATIPTHVSFHKLLGLDEQAFMRATQATFKLGIAFENWARDGDRYLHSFGTIGKSMWMGGFQHLWLEAHEHGFGGELGEYCLEWKAAEAGKFQTSDDPQLNYAYHLDASLYAQFLRRFAERHGAKRVEGKIAEVALQPETGFIAALVLESGVRIEGDLFVDCTGFRALLIEQTLQTGFEDWSEWLATDAAWAMQTESTGPAVPYTRSIAHEAGWRWRIPLQHRVGNGLVFASAYLDENEAREKLVRSVTGKPLTEPRLIKYRAGRRRKAWTKNCVALGLSSGFLEPLESTSIHLIQLGVTRLIQLFPFNGVDTAVAAQFNDLSRAELEHIRDFLILHYALTERDDSPFWDRCRTMPIPETLRRRIALFREDAQAYQTSGELFRVDSWLQVMLGQRLQPRGRHHMARLMPREQLRGLLQTMRTSVASAVAQMPAHQDFVGRYCGVRADDAA